MSLSKPAERLSAPGGPKTTVDLCSVDPGFDADHYISTDLRTVTAVWRGLDTVRAARSTERLMLSGDRQLISDMQAWLELSPFAAKERKIAEPATVGSG